MGVVEKPGAGLVEDLRAMEARDVGEFLRRLGVAGLKFVAYIEIAKCGSFDSPAPTFTPKSKCRSLGPSENVWGPVRSG